VKGDFAFFMHYLLEWRSWFDGKKRIAKGRPKDNAAVQNQAIVMVGSNRKLRP